MMLPVIEPSSADAFFASHFNDSAHVEQRTNQGDFKLRSVKTHRLYAMMIDE